MMISAKNVVLFTVMLLHCEIGATQAQVKTWDGRHSIEKIAVRVVYFVPNDRKPLRDWQDRAAYYCRRIEQFHQREYGGQSTLTTTLESEPVVSSMSTTQLRDGDANAIFFKTLREVDERLKFAQDETNAFPILLALSEINWKPLNDFYRVNPGKDGFEFEGNFHNGQHFPGAASGGARATYLADQRKGWGLVSADGWRVPYRGSDCVVYHEGVGHTVGLPHPKPGNGSVMSQGQYRGWLSESWLDKEQKLHMGWAPEEQPKIDSKLELFTKFRALPEPINPKPGQEVSLKFDWPNDVKVKDCSVRFQTDMHGSWVESPASITDASLGLLDSIVIGTFDSPTPVSYRVNVTLRDGRTAEIWGYFQVRDVDGAFPVPFRSAKTVSDTPEPEPRLTQKNEVDVLAMLNVEDAWKQGNWTEDVQGRLLSPIAFGTRIELPVDVPQQYRMTVIAEPLDEPNGLLIGSRMGEHRFATLINYRPKDVGLSALENVDGRNVGNATTVERNLLKKNRLSQIIVTVLIDQVTVSVDGENIIRWTGSADKLSLGDYWSTPNKQALFLGTYDCRYRFYRVSLSEIE